MTEFTFRQALLEDEEAIFQLVTFRVDWMDRQGLHQWNENGYLEAYPLDYYRQNIGSFRVAVEDGQVVAAAAVLLEDENWPQDKPAFYLHNLVAHPDCHGAGGALLKDIEQLARQQGMAALRLDSDVNNQQLGQYY